MKNKLRTIIIVLIIIESLVLILFDINYINDGLLTFIGIISIIWAIIDLKFINNYGIH